MERFDIKPKLAFFQYRYDQSLPEFLLFQKEEHVKCLAQFFDVSVINHDCDYQQICDTLRPDLTLVESGVSYPSCSKLNVTNKRACPEIPKIGFMNSDAFCGTREGFVSDMAQWGIDTAFSIATTAPEHTPHIVEHLFVWPVFVDVDVYRDYGQWKNIPVLFTGNANSLYPWRQRVTSIVSRCYPSLICPHPGYAPRNKQINTRIRFMVGEEYARLLNASRLVFACGTVAKDVIRKHFEIPASRACLVTEGSAALEAAGFVDMKNCVFADQRDVLHKLDYLFTHPEELEAITEAGHQLVRLRHTLKQRDQIRQWFDLQRRLKTGEAIVQSNPFEPLRIADRSVVSRLPRITSDGEHLRLLREGDEKLMASKYDEAENLYTRCWNYIPWMPEPHVRIAICQLCKGDAKAALHWISQPLRFTMAEYRSDEPDPVEWAYFIIILLCQGRIQEAAERAAQFTWLQHSDLDRVRSVIGVVAKGGGDDVAKNTLPEQRVSIHRLPLREFEDWKRHLCLMLNACGQTSLADKLALWNPGAPNHSLQGDSGSKTARLGHTNNVVPSVGRAATAWQNDPRLGGKPSLYSKVRQNVRRASALVLHHLETRFGYFLPYHLSYARHDEFYNCVEQIAERDDVRSVLVLGTDKKKYTAQALLAGIRRNINKVATLYLATDDRNCEQRGSAIGGFKREKNIGSFDLVLIDISEHSRRRKRPADIEPYCLEAKFVVIEGMDEISRYPEYRELVRSTQHVPLVSDPGLRNGYAIYERRDREPARTNACKAHASCCTPEFMRAGL